MFSNRALLILGFVLRFLLIFLVTSQSITEWFYPFVRETANHLSLDPWSSYIEHTQDLKAFPYGIVMFITFIPSVVVNFICDSLLLTKVSILLTFTAFDFITYVLLKQMLVNQNKFLIIWWWLNPLVIIPIYVIGQTDIVPIAIVVASLFLIQRKQFFYAAIAFSCAISAKYSMLVLLPFILLYLIKTSVDLKNLYKFAMPFVATSLILCCVPMLSSGYRQMVLNTSEAKRIFDFYIPIGQYKIYLTLVFLSLVVYQGWKLAYYNFNLLVSLCGIALMCLILTTSTPPGWYLWIVPFFVLYLATGTKYQKFLFVIFSVVVSVVQLLFSNITILDHAFSLSRQLNLYSIFVSIIFCIGAILTFSFYRESILKNILYKISRRPISIAIAGDSGVGKDTLAENLIGILGEHNVTHISGDDYHNYDRKSTAWNIVTHLNPKANNLSAFFHDIKDLILKNKVYKRVYSHSSGRFSDLLFEEPKKILICSGLHALYSGELNKVFDLKIFLKMDKNLRIYFKSRRDVLIRGHSYQDVVESIEKREPDYYRYIEIQENIADLVFTLKSVETGELDFNNESLPKMYLQIKLDQDLDVDRLITRLMCIYGIYVEVEKEHAHDRVPSNEQINDLSINNDHKITLNLYGDPLSEQIKLFLTQEIDYISDLLINEQAYKSGLFGIMQMISLFKLNNATKYQ